MSSEPPRKSSCCFSVILRVSQNFHSHAAISQVACSMLLPHGHASDGSLSNWVSKASPLYHFVRPRHFRYSFTCVSCAAIWALSHLSCAPSECSGWIVIRIPSNTQTSKQFRSMYESATQPASGFWSELLRSLTCTKLEHLILKEWCHRCDGQHSYCTSAFFDLHPLLAHPIALAGLRTLVLSPNNASTITLTDTDIVILARTCPYLAVFDLRARNTPISLYALSFLVGRCRELRQVLVCVDARLDALGRTLPKNDASNDRVSLQPNTRLLGLHIGESPIACVGLLRPSTAPDLMRSIPRFLHTMAPRVECIMKPSFEGRYARRWKMVSTALSVMVKEAKDKAEDDDVLHAMDVLL
ncbi:uncharacterized protein BJ212DRAFT_758490 [Suillus subaureus]|uniref:Uncharacterized protein n=1 Tax=Suillus subaureus TaxID=48587 RepID=A0A9P7J836_9AGAM|nr:uncharacterized protein BJ212DRAFT_758490 [Suillus subaureus]KAG1807310.1 hypothetical protein BJ212DRAFT_758490 [Suillus subaureus]